MAIKPIEGFRVHDQETGQDGVAKVSYSAIDGAGEASAEDIQSFVNEWLEANPDVTTSLQDGEVTGEKINRSVSITNEAVDNLLKGFGFYDNVKAAKYRAHDTDCYYVTIPLNDSDGNIIQPYIAVQSAETPAQYARSHSTTVTCNGSLAILRTDGAWVSPPIFSRGVKVGGRNFTGTSKSNGALTLSINEDRTFTEFPLATTEEELSAGGAYNAFTVYYKIVENGSALDLTGVTANEDGVVTDKHPRLAIGIRDDLTLVVFACDGRTGINAGLTSAELSSEMVSLGCEDAWNCDGGGSTSLSYKCSKLNRNIDGNGTVDRMITTTFNIKRGV